jgi:hypothetical protein
VKARILALDSDEHRRAQELLPWFVNGTLDGDEAALVAAHVAGCSRCLLDADEQARLRSAGADAAPLGDVDRGWALLRARLEADAAAAPGEAPLTPSAARADGAPAMRSTRRWWRPALPLALSLQAVVILALAGVLVAILPRSEPYRALGAAPDSAEPNALVVFSGEATNAQIGAALHAVDAHIVGGPTVTGAYLLRIGAAAPAALDHLRAQPGVLGAETLQGRPTP